MQRICNHTQHQRAATGLLVLVFFALAQLANAQEIVWEKRIALKKDDKIKCMAQDQEGNIYLGGSTMRGGIKVIGTEYYRAMVIKLDPNGDTLYSRILPEQGEVLSMVQDKSNILHVNVKLFAYSPAYAYDWVALKMTTDGFIFRRDTIIPGGFQPFPNHCILASDSSVIITGNRWTNNRNGMFFQRVNPDYTLGEFKVFQPGNTSTEGNNIEELPNGRIMISGPFSNRLGSVEVNKDGTGDSSWVWVPDSTTTSYQTYGVLHQAHSKGYLGLNSPRIFSYDSTKGYGLSIRPYNYAGLLSAHLDGSFVYFTSNVSNNRVWKRNADTSVAWAFNLLTNSTLLPGLQKRLTGVLYNEDQSAIFCGYLNFIDTAYRSDPYLIKIAHVGTPVTSLVKPKKGVLQNESLAPWPNPSSNTVYLMQHFNQAEVRLYNLAGKEMGEYHLRFAMPIDVSRYASGIYLYRAVIDGKNYSGKIVRR